MENVWKNWRTSCSPKIYFGEISSTRKEMDFISKKMRLIKQHISTQAKLSFFNQKHKNPPETKLCKNPGWPTTDQQKKDGSGSGCCLAVLFKWRSLVL
ncbi:hypothetical protein ACOSP7_032805 [Xanthoceras sorbifolium]